MGHSMSSGPISGNIPTSSSPISMKFYQSLQIPFKLSSVKFQLRIIINGWCASITNVDVTFVAAGFFTINNKVLRAKLFSGQTRQATGMKFGVPRKLGVLNAIIILPLLKICPDLYYACPK